MVDVGGKAETRREALALGRIEIGPQVMAALLAGDTPKGDVIAVARVAAIQAVKKTSDLIPLCHPLPVRKVSAEFEVLQEEGAIEVRVLVACTGPTGVEMEALTGAGVACLTLYDMLKGIDKGMTIGPIQLLEKRGGKSGDWVRG